MKPNINNTNTCYVCGAEELGRSHSLHIWIIVYECGCRIWGALDTETHSIDVDNKCPYETDL